MVSVLVVREMAMDVKETSNLVATAMASAMAIRGEEMTLASFNVAMEHLIKDHLIKDLPKITTMLDLSRAMATSVVSLKLKLKVMDSNAVVMVAKLMVVQSVMAQPMVANRMVAIAPRLTLHLMEDHHMEPPLDLDRAMVDLLATVTRSLLAQAMVSRDQAVQVTGSRNLAVVDMGSRDPVTVATRAMEHLNANLDLTFADLALLSVVDQLFRSHRGHRETSRPLRRVKPQRDLSQHQTGVEMVQVTAEVEAEDMADTD